jgi:hypothetical protein
MGSTTAMVFLGSPSWDGGLNVDRTLHLVEGDRASWVLLPNEGTERIMWDVDPENLVEDLLALIGIHVLDHGVPAPFRAERLSVPDVRNAGGGELDAAAALARTMGGKAAVVAFEDSTLNGQLTEFGQLENQDVEVCTSCYSRSFAEFTEEWVVNGELPST